MEKERKKVSIKSNYIYNLIYQLLLVLVPIFVTPYLTRVLFSDGLGKYSFTYSIANYFVLFANLGFTLYAQRFIAQQKNDKKRQSLAFWEIFIIRIITTVVSLGIYYLIIFNDVFDQKYYILLIIQSINIIAVAFDFAFLLQGNEDFKKIAIRNIIVKLLGFTSIFIFVKQEQDLWIYTLIQCLIIFVSNISLIYYLPRYLVKISVKEINLKRHIKPTLILFIPTVAQAVYTTIDRALIGLITNDDSLVGNYDTAEKFVKMCFSATAALVTVYLPRNSLLYQEGKIEELKNNGLFLIKFIFLIGLPMVLGLIIISNRVMPLYLGEEYGIDNINNTTLLLKLLSPLIVIMGIGNAVGSGILFCVGKDVKYTICVIIGAILNLVLNLILIQYYNNIGATISTLAAEFVVTSLLVFFSRKYIDFKKVFIESWKYFIAAGLMFILCYFENKWFPSNVISIVAIILSGACVYFISLLLLRDKIVYTSLNKIINKVFKRNKI